MRTAAFISLFATFVLWVTPAQAQDCGRWSQPVLCTAELLANDNDAYRNETLDRNQRVSLAPRRTLELELEGRDQSSRRFDVRRLALAYDDRDCRSLIEVENLGEGHLRISPTSSTGGCVLDVWTPNNLNFYWELELTIELAARAGYERLEAEIVADALYQGLLGRAADSSGLQAAVSEIRSGNLESQINAMVRSPEFQQSIGGTSWETLLDRFYDGILQRSADTEGLRLYLPELRRGRYAAVVLALIRSPEFEARLQRVRVPGNVAAQQTSTSRFGR